MENKQFQKYFLQIFLNKFQSRIEEKIKNRKTPTNNKKTTQTNLPPQVYSHYLERTAKNEWTAPWKIRSMCPVSHMKT